MHVVQGEVRLRRRRWIGQEEVRRGGEGGKNRDKEREKK